MGGIVDFLPVSGEPYIVCDHIKWSIKIGKSKYCAKIKKYDGLYDFYLDLRAVSENVFLKDDKLILHHKNDTLTIEEGNKGYITYRNGRKEKGKVDEQGIFEYASEFLTQVNPEDITEKMLADVKSVKSLYVWHYLKYALLVSVLWSAFGLFLALSESINWVLCTVIFFAFPLFILIGSICAFGREKERRYIITATKIYYFYGNISKLSLDISQIKEVKLHRSLIRKGVGTIKIRQKGGLTFGYGLIAVREAEKVYHLIRQKSAL